MIIVYNVFFIESNIILYYEVIGLKIFILYVFNVIVFILVGYGKWVKKVVNILEDSEFFFKY